MLDDGVSEIDNCKRELKEETGFISHNIEYV
jgi:ADP-ribose pyrophosphatase YjhB (NUDIX family)